MEVVTALGGAVGNAVLSASIEGLLEMLTSMGLTKYAGKEKIFDELKKWEKLLGELVVLLYHSYLKNVSNY